MYQDLSTRHDWPVKKTIVDLPIRIKGNSKRSSGNSLSPLGAQNKDISAASQTFLTGVRWRLQRRFVSVRLSSREVPSSISKCDLKSLFFPFRVA